MPSFLYKVEFRMDKQKVIGRIGRKVGSGPEVTINTARYFQGLLRLLESHKGNGESEDFLADYGELIESLAGRRQEVEKTEVIRSRIFTPSQKSATVLDAFFEGMIHCEICEGFLNPAGNVQHNHIIRHQEGGPTRRDNQRLTHPFCNNQRDAIENYRKGLGAIKLPWFRPAEDPDSPVQLSFFDDEFFLQ